MALFPKCEKQGTHASQSAKDPKLYGLFLHFKYTPLMPQTSGGFVIL